jgi:Ca-activated chloride channel homolog
MDDISFAFPSYLHALWLLPALVLLRLRLRRSARIAEQTLVAQRLVPRLVARSSATAQWAIFLLQLLALACFILAVAQPRWGVEKRTIIESGRNVIMALDTSKSMLADDVKPDRLTKAKLAAQDMVSALREERIGIIAFAGRAYLQAPLTTDHAAVIETLQAIDAFTIPRGGSTIVSALREAIDTFGKTKARSHGLILFSDGAEPDPALEAVLAEANEKHVRIITIGVGTELGALIPDPDNPGAFVINSSTGSPVHSKLDSAVLQQIAVATGGRYLQLGSQNLTNAVVAEAVGALDRSESGAREEVKPIERFYWPLGLGIVALMYSLLMAPRARFLVQAIGLATLFMAASATPAQAALLSFGESADMAKRSFDSGDFAVARDMYARLMADDPEGSQRHEYAYGIAAASHGLKDYDRAVQSFSEALLSQEPTTQQRTHSAMGNTLYEQGAKSLQQQPDFTIKAWNDAVTHYESALLIKEDKEVRDNLDFVNQALQQVKQQQQQKKDQQKEKGDKSKEKSEKGQEGEESEDGESGEEKDGQQSEQKEGKEGKEGEKKEGKEGKQGDQQAKDGKGGKAEKLTEEEALKAEEERAKQKLLREGKIEAGEQGKPAEMSKEEIEEMLNQKPDARTGFSKMEARDLLRTYSEQMMLQFQQQGRDPPVKKDW